MTVKHLLILLVLFLHQFASAKLDTLTQEQRFEQIYFETAVTLSGSDFQRALQVSDSLYQHAVSELQKVKALMLMATLLHQEGEINQSIVKAIEADKLATKNSLIDWEARIAGFLSTRYRDLGLYKQGEIYLKKGRELGGKMKEEGFKRIYLGMVCQETAYYELELENYQKAIRNIKQASNYFKDIPEGVNKSYFTATNEELLGRAYIGEKEPQKALVHLQNAHQLMNEIGQDDASIMGLINNGIGVAFMELRQLDSAIVYLLNANEKAEASNYLILKVEVYKSLSVYYKAISDYENYAVFNDKYLVSLKEVERKKKEFLNLFVNDIETRGNLLRANQTILIISVIILAVVLLSIVFFYQKSKKKNFLRFQKMLHELKERQKIQASTGIQFSAVVESPEKKKLQIAEATEIKILEDLNEFEKGEKYTDKTMSLSVLAGMIGTNTKYLSYVLNSHKGKDFSTYINELRVRYIALKMEEDPTYKSYKISYLADESGFSSHSKFSAVFKTVTGFTPSTFLDFLTKQKAIE